MKLGTRARYSVRMMMAIAKLSVDGKPVSLSDAATHCGLSRRYLDQLVTPLRNSSLVRGRMGRGGGYLLGRPPEEIRLKDIIEAAIGPIAIADCVAGFQDCMYHEFCTCKGLWVLINRRISTYLQKFTLADMLAPTWNEKLAEEMAMLDAIEEEQTTPKGT